MGKVKALIGSITTGRIHADFVDFYKLHDALVGCDLRNAAIKNDPATLSLVRFLSVSHTYRGRGCVMYSCTH